MAKKDKAAAEAAEAKEAADKKAKKGAKEKPGKKEKKPKGEKKKGKIIFKIILILLLIVVVAGLGLSFFFDWLHIRTGMMDLLSKIGPEGRKYTDVLQQREFELDEKENELNQKQDELQAQADDLAATEAHLDMLQENLDEREAELSQIEIANTPVYRGDLSEEKLAELKNLGKIYSSMDPESAATILSQLYATADMASILFYMDKTAAAGVLAALSPEISAQITAEMLRE